MWQFRTSVFNKVVWSRELGKVENECISNNFSLFAIILPKTIKIGGHLTKFWQKQFCTVFWDTVYVKAYFEPKFCPVKNPPKIFVLGENVVKMQNFHKAHCCTKQRLLMYWRQNRRSGPGSSKLGVTKKELAEWTFGKQLSHIWGKAKSPDRVIM